jgi:predicted O-methyltransferase YrrM
MDQAILDIMAELEMRSEREKMRGVADGLDALDPEAAKLLYIIALGGKAKNIIEVGAGAGYSTLWLGAAAKALGGNVVSCEIDPAKAAEAQSNIAKAGLSDYVTILAGDARETLRDQEGAVDLLFIDATFGHYETFFDVVYKRLDVGSMVIADNVVEDAYELDDYITYVQNHPNLDSQTVSIGDGLEMTVRIS